MAKKNPPRASVTASRANLVDSLVSTTFAPGSTAPVLSATVPRRLPAFCANASGAQTKASSVNRTRLNTRLDISLSQFSRVLLNARNRAPVNVNEVA